MSAHLAKQTELSLFHRLANIAIDNCKNISITSVQVFLTSGWTDTRFSSYRQPMGKTIIVCDNPEGITLGQSYLVKLTGSVS